MNKVLYAIVSVLALTSCANSFHITGTTSVSGLDGQKLYLKVLKDTTLKNLDSCDVVHGQFQFGGTTDSVRVANIILDDGNSLPVVLEDGDIQVKIDNTQETVTGTPLNDKLTKFRQQFTRLMNESSDLVHQHDQAIMNGRNMEEVNTRLAAKDAGPYVFITICMNKYNVPMLDAWVEDIMTRATDKFKNNPQVKEYYEAAQENQNIMNGTKVPDNQSQPQQTSPAPPQDGQTPNEMAQ